MNLKIEIQKNIFLKTTITNHSRFKDPNIYFLPDFHLFFFFFFFPPGFQYTNGSCVVFLVHGTILQQSLARLFISGWHNSLKVTVTIVQQWLAWLFNSHWHDYSTVAGTIVQQSLARFFNSGWHGSSTVAGTILQQSRAWFFLFSMLAEFFNSDVHCWRIVPGTRNTTHDPYQLLFFSMLWLITCLEI